MLELSGRIYMDLLIDGKPMGDAPNLVKTIILTEGVAALCPAAQLVLNDYGDKLTKSLSLSDSNRIEVVIGKSPQDIATVKRKYRLYGLQPSVASVDGPTLTLTCIYDAPEYLVKSVIESHEGTSSDVIKKIIGKCSGLNYTGPDSFNGKTTNDKQKWLIVNRSRASAVQQEIARHGYIDDKSAMVVSLLSATGELRYRNMIDLINHPVGQIEHHFYHNKPASGVSGNLYLVEAQVTQSNAGMMNTWINYGSTRYSPKLDGKTCPEKKCDVDVKGNYLAVNNEVSGKVDRARFDYGHLDCGNVCPKYERAFYQNVKQLALFSERVSLLCYMQTKVNVLDSVVYRQSNADISTPSSSEDVYVVVGKTIFIQRGMFYAERIELVKLTVKNKGGCQLKSSGGESGGDMSLKDGSAAVPDSHIDKAATTTAAASLDTMHSVQQDCKQSTKDMEALTTSCVAVPSATKELMKNTQAAQLQLNQFNQTGDAKSLVAASNYIATGASAYEKSVTPFRENLSTSAASFSSVAAGSPSVQALDPRAANALLAAPKGPLEVMSVAIGALNLDSQNRDLLLAVAGQITQSGGSSSLLGVAGSNASMMGSLGVLQSGNLSSTKDLQSMFNTSVTMLSATAPAGTVDKDSLNQFSALMAMSTQPGSGSKFNDIGLVSTDLSSMLGNMALKGQQFPSTGSDAHLDDYGIPRPPIKVETYEDYEDPEAAKNQAEASSRYRSQIASWASE